MIKDIVVNLGLGATDCAGDFALTVADKYAAHVMGVAFAYEPIIPGLTMGGIPPEFIETQRAESDAAARKAAARFEQAARRAGIAAESRIIAASISGAADQLGQIARRFDLAVVGQPTKEGPAAEEIVDEGVLFESGRPVIYVPTIQKKGLSLERVMVCWDGSRAATRAIADAMPFLEAAQQIEIVMIASKGFKADEAPGTDLAKHLARHALRVELKRITAPQSDVASMILSHAADTNAGFIVMGGYGHSRLREFILGGATRGVLEAMTVPTLMSH